MVSGLRNKSFLAFRRLLLVLWRSKRNKVTVSSILNICRTNFRVIYVRCKTSLMLIFRTSSRNLSRSKTMKDSAPTLRPESALNSSTSASTRQSMRQLYAIAVKNFSRSLWLTLVASWKSERSLTRLPKCGRLLHNISAGFSCGWVVKSRSSTAKHSQRRWTNQSRSSDPSKQDTSENLPLLVRSVKSWEICTHSYGQSCRFWAHWRTQICG